MISPKEFIDKNYPNQPIDEFSIGFIMDEYAKLWVIEELEKCVEHPSKPGYKRHDIIKRLKELKSL